MFMFSSVLIIPCVIYSKIAYCVVFSRYGFLCIKISFAFCPSGLSKTGAGNHASS